MSRQKPLQCGGCFGIFTVQHYCYDAPAAGHDLATHRKCPACGEQGEYWEDRVPVHDSIAGFEIRAAGIRHPNGRLCTDW